MMFGQSFSSGFGEPDHTLAGLDAEQRGTLVDVILYGRAGFGDTYYGIYVNCQLVQTVFLPDGGTSQTISVPALDGDISIQALSNGWCAGLDQSGVSRGLDSETSTKATVQWDWSYDFLPTRDTSGNEDLDLGNWTMVNLTPDSGQLVSQTRRTLSVKLDVAADSSGTVTIDTGTTTITGTGPGNSTIVLSDGNGITGTVDIGGGIAEGSYNKTLTYRYPAFTTVYRDGVSVGTVNFGGTQTTTFTDVALDPGVYFYTLVNTSDTGAVGTASTPVTVQIETVPAPVTDLHYLSGTSYTCYIGWTPPYTTDDVVYNVYVRRIGQPIIDTIEPYVQSGADSALITNLGFNGTVEVMVRTQSVTSGLEECNPFILEMQFDNAGNYIPPRPNVVRIIGAKSSGLTATFNVLYPTAGEKGVATKVRIYPRSLTYPPTYGAWYADEQTLVDNGNGYKTATLTYTATSGYIAAWVARAVTAADTEGSNSQEQVVYVSDSAPAPVNITATTSRG